MGHRIQRRERRIAIMGLGIRMQNFDVVWSLVFARSAPARGCAWMNGTRKGVEL